MKNVTIFHYHLQKGGVTTVIQMGVEAVIRYIPELKAVRLVCGSASGLEEFETSLMEKLQKAGCEETGRKCLETDVMPEIGYLESDVDDFDIRADKLAEKLLAEYGGSLWWIHNYQLGKNALFTAALLRIAKRNRKQKLLFHIHDFPECARFDNLRNLRAAGLTDLYLQQPNIAYALINERDRRFLSDAGISEDRLFLLNNPVEAPRRPRGADFTGKMKNLCEHFSTDYTKLDSGAPAVYYPVRAIRRKNILEAGLICAAAERNVNLIVGLPGLSERERNYSAACRHCFEKGLIPGIFGSGTLEGDLYPTYNEMLENSQMIISSSVQEGFGYLFVNAVQLDAPLFARNLDILDGIREVFPAERSIFYDEVDVPLTKAEGSVVRDMYIDKLEYLKKFLSRDAENKLLAEAAEIGRSSTAGFSYLPVNLQIRCLDRIGESAEYSEELRRLNPEIFGSFSKLLEAGRKNERKTISEFSLEAHATGARTIFRAIQDNGKIETGPEADGERIQQYLIDKFSQMEYMRLLYDYE